MPNTHFLDGLEAPHYIEPISLYDPAKFEDQREIMNFVLFFLRIVCFSFLAVASLVAILKACGLKSGKFVKTVFYLTLAVSVSSLAMAIL